MIEFLLASGLSCAGSQELVNRVNAYALKGLMPKDQIQEVIEVIKEDNPECFNERSEHN
jgi:predicted oxidoreductase (fatty acid repression mutant protein)|tara:strand:- start:30 stop:206 length:177 start_codon:yes stop_codon:yes gene_type:complete